MHGWKFIDKHQNTVVHLEIVGRIGSNLSEREGGLKAGFGKLISVIKENIFPIERHEENTHRKD